MKYKFGILFIYVTLFCNSATAARSALVIVDMQTEFLADFHNEPGKETSQLPLLKASLVNLIRVAKANQAPVVLVEYKGYGPTIYEVSQELKAYAHVYRIVKKDDGVFDSNTEAEEKILQVLQKAQVSDLVFAGVNGAACVCDSINGALANKYHVTAYVPAIANIEYESTVYPYWSDEYSISSQNYRQTNELQKVTAILAKGKSESASCEAALQMETLTKKLL